MQINKGALALAITAALSAQASGVAASTGATVGITSADTMTSGRAPHFTYPKHSRRPSDAVLYDQSGISDGFIPSQNFQAAYDAYDSEAADDFVVTDAAGWTISGVNAQVTFFGGSAPAGFTSDVNIYADSNNAPGAPVCTYAAAPGAVDGTGTSVSIAFASPCLLAPGRHWISVVGNVDFPPKFIWMAGAGAAIDNVAMWRQPADGDGTGCATWTTMSDCIKGSSVVGSGDSNALFQLIGSVGADAGCGPGEICLVSTVGTDTSAGACAAADTIDSTSGDELNFCYTVTNNTSVDLNFQTLANNVDGSFFDLRPVALPAGGAFQFNYVATVGATATYNSTWTAQDVLPSYSSEVNSGTGCSDRIFADGFDEETTPCLGGNFIDITTSGTALGLDDDGIADVTMPFSFNFYGMTSNHLTVSNNGGALFNSPGAFLDYFNASLPAANITAPALLPLWDDFASTSGDVYTDTRGVSPNRQFIVEWFDRVHFFGSSNTDGATFELILNEDNTIQFEYLDVGYSAFGNLSQDPNDCTGGLCATIGIQGAPALFNQFSMSEASVTNNSEIKWTPSNSPQVFTSSDTVTVNVGVPDINLAPPSLSGTVPAGATTTTTLDIQNVGNRDLLWTADEALPAKFHFPIGPRYAPSTKKPGETNLSAARPPASWLQAHHAQKPAHQARTQVPLSGTPAFGCNIISSSACDYVSFDADAPGTSTTIATENELAFGGSFYQDDFTKEYVIGYPGGDLQTIDTTTGAMTDIGPTGLGTATRDIAYDAQTGTLFGTAIDGSSTDLFTVDVTTGAMTLISTINGLGPSAYVMGLAVDPNSGLMYGIEILTSSLVAIDKTTGEASVIGPLGYNTRFGQGLDFNAATGVLYLASIDYDTFTQNMYTVDLATGQATLVSPMANVIQTGAFAIAIPSGPCSQPADQPWLSLDQTSGTTTPAADTPVTVTIDGTGHVDGDVLAGTVCVRSNDPDERTIAVPVEFTVGGTAVIPPTLSKAFNPATVPAGTPSTLTITLTNGDAAPATLTSSLTDTLPNGMTVAATPNASTTCGGTLTATAGTDSVVLDAAGAVIPAAGACDIVVDVETAAAGTFDNNIPPAALQTVNGSNAAPANASLIVDPPVPTAPTAGGQFNPATVQTGTPTTLTITLGNTNAQPATLSAPFADALPIGLLVAPTPNASTTCGGALTAATGDTSVSLDSVNAAIPATGSCTIQVDVEAANPGTFVNTIVAGTLQTDAGNNAVDTVATLTVTPQPAPPTVAKAFNPSTVAKGVASTLTITLANIEATAAQLTAPLTDAFPTGLVVAAVPNASTTCGGTVTAVANADSVTLDNVGSVIPASGSCTVTVDVESATPASYANDIPVDSLQTDQGNNTASADATLDVTP